MLFRSKLSKFSFLSWYSYFVLSASCCNEAFKIATSSAAYLNNYFMLIGTDGVYSYTFEHEKREDCPVCGGEALELSVNSELTIEQLIDMLVEKQDMQVIYLLIIFTDYTNAFTTLVKSRNPLSRRLQRRSTCKLRPNSNKPHAPT